MERPTTTLRIGEWCVNPASGQISRNGEIARVEVRTMRLLLCLADHPGEVVNIDTLLDQVWPDVTVSPDSVYQAVASLRRLLGDDPKQPTYIATVPRLGYRLVAQVDTWTEDIDTRPKKPLTPQPLVYDEQLPAAMGDSADARFPPPTAVVSTRSPRIRSSLLLLAGAVIALALVAALAFRDRLAKEIRPNPPAGVAAIASQPQKSVAVIPFLDLTQGMKEGEFADGMTEELIDKLSEVPGLRVPSPTSSFYFKDKTVTVAEIAKELKVAYILDGSVRKSGDRLRVATRLVRADDGYIAWSETYDRPFHDILTVQDDIACKVAKALKTSIG